MDNMNSIMIKNPILYTYEIKFEIHINNEFKPHN